MVELPKKGGQVLEEWIPAENNPLVSCPSSEKGISEEQCSVGGASHLKEKLPCLAETASGFK